MHRQPFLQALPTACSVVVASYAAHAYDNLWGPVASCRAAAWSFGCHEYTGIRVRYPSTSFPAMCGPCFVVLQLLGPSVAKMAEVEGLEAHRRAVTLRLGMQ
jgi:hypothetical protein